jgi:hypothetical protein
VVKKAGTGRILGSNNGILNSMPLGEVWGGTLLALRPEITIESLGLQTEVAKKLFFALQNYGAYTVDDTFWNSHAFNLESGVMEEVKNEYGFDFATEDPESPWFKDANRLFRALSIVTNNGPRSVGGGGVPRQPLLTPLRN